MTANTTIPCHGCGRTFGGHDAWSRHLSGSKCLGERRLRFKGLVQRPDGVWIRPGSTQRTPQLPLEMPVPQRVLRQFRRGGRG